MEIKELLNSITEILEKLNSPKILNRHLQIVYSTAYDLLRSIKNKWPSIIINEELVLFGAGTHDIGKVEIKTELFQSGKKHEEVGKYLLQDLGFTEDESRFAFTHGNWQQEGLVLEDLLVSLADKIWKGKRIDELEEKVINTMSDRLKISFWEIYEPFNDILEHLSTGADKRLLWQSQ